jgi:AP-3 complex subunit beta
VRPLDALTRRKKSSKSFYSDDEGSPSEEGDEDHASDEAAATASLTVSLAEDLRFSADHKVLLQASLPLLKSRNAGVVLGVCSLHHYCGSDDAAIQSQLAKALVRILRNRSEVQFVILTSIRSIAAQRPRMFSGFVQDFFIKGTDPLYNR